MIEEQKWQEEFERLKPDLDLKKYIFPDGEEGYFDNETQCVWGGFLEAKRSSQKENEKLNEEIEAKKNEILMLKNIIKELENFISIS
jgi:hypothetical protein